MPKVSLVATVVSLLFAAPLMSCAAEVLEEVPTPVASVVEPQVGERAETAPREVGPVNEGGRGASLAYLEETSLRTVRDDDAETVDPFVFLLDAPSGMQVRMPDFSALSKRGYDFTYSTGDFMRSPVYATTSRGDVYYFEGYSRGSKESARFGYGIAHAAPGRDAEVFDVHTDAYAFFPSDLLVRAPNDVFVGASIVKKGTFGPDFPGCPISILHGQNGVYLAHIDAYGLHEISFPGEGRLSTLSLADNGSLVVETGWPDAGVDPYEANVVERWTMSTSGVWTRLARKVTPAKTPM